MAVITWLLLIYIGLVVISLTLPYVAFRINRKPNQNTIGDYVEWMNGKADDIDDISYIQASFIPILHIVTAILAIVVIIGGIVGAVYNRIKDIKIV